GIRDFHVTGVQTCALPISITIRRRCHPVTQPVPAIPATAPPEWCGAATTCPVTPVTTPPAAAATARSSPGCTREYPARCDTAHRSEERRVRRVGGAQQASR